MRFMQGSLEYMESGKFQISENDGQLIEFDWPVCISGLPPQHYHELCVAIQTRPTHFLKIAESTMQSAGVLVSSFLEMEEKVVEECRRLERDENTKVLPLP